MQGMTDAIASRLGGARHSFSQADDIFQVRVSLIDIEPPIWRRVIVPKEVTLPRFHTILQPVMGWTDSHLHQFKVGDLRFGEPDDDSAPGPIDHSRVTLSQILPDTGSTCVDEYDFSDRAGNTLAPSDWKERVKASPHLWDPTANCVLVANMGSISHRTCLPQGRSTAHRRRRYHDDRHPGPRWPVPVRLPVNPGGGRRQKRLVLNTRGLVAQGIEQRFPKPRVGGSSPSGAMPICIA